MCHCRHNLGGGDEKDDPRLDEASDLEEAIYKTQAHTLAGILVKLRIVAQNTRADPNERRPTVATAYRRRGRDFSDWAAVSAGADAERLASAAGRA